jgi:NTP pyrophosphatase (non-canonical NTP hydrolase)
MDSIEQHPMIRANYPTWLTRRANRNLQKWGVQDLETLGLAVAEECGELCQAILQARHEGGDSAAIAREAIDLGALCLQVLLANAKTHGPANFARFVASVAEEANK